MFSIMLLWPWMALFCCAVVLSGGSNRLSESIESIGLIESIGSIGSSGLRAFSVEAEDSSFNVDLSAVVVARVLSGLWALITLELGFLWRPFDVTVGWVDGSGVADV